MMAMLAEPRFKRKISINPNGNDWSKDDTKFGQKLLKKFGWSEGKGLGAKEDGISNHIKVDYKFGNKGVGYKKNQSDNWIAHQDDFNAILANLNEGNNEQQTSVSSIESTSKKSRSRVHYQKFVQGKDLSRRSATDLDSIFGVRKEKKQGKKAEKEEEEREEKAPCKPQAEVDTGSLVTYNSTQSLQEYFAQKMAEKKKGIQPVSNHDETTTARDSVESRSTSEKKKHKKKRKSEVAEEEAEPEETQVKFSLGDEAENSEIKKKKKKKRKISDVEEVSETFDKEECVKKSKKSKKKQKEEKTSSEQSPEEEGGIVVDSPSVMESENNDNKNEDFSHQLPTEPKTESSEAVEVPRKKKKKSKKGESGNDVKATDGRAKRVVFDSEGNLERIEDTEKQSVNISKESYMKTFMPNYTEKVQAGGTEKQTVVKKGKTRNQKRNSVSSETPTTKLKIDKHRKASSLHKPEQLSKQEECSTKQTFVKESKSVKRKVFQEETVMNRRKKGLQKRRDNRKSTKHGANRASLNTSKALQLPSRKKKTLCSRNELRKNLPHEIETKLPSVLQVFKSRGASMHTIGGVYEKPVERKTVKRLSKNQRKKQLRNISSTEKPV